MRADEAERRDSREVVAVRREQRRQRRRREPVTDVLKDGRGGHPRRACRDSRLSYWLTHRVARTYHVTREMTTVVKSQIGYTSKHTRAMASG